MKHKQRSFLPVYEGILQGGAVLDEGSLCISVLAPNFGKKDFTADLRLLVICFGSPKTTEFQLLLHRHLKLI